TLDWALRLAIIITMPAAVGLTVLAKPILITMFQYDAFLPLDVEMTALSLSAYALGLPAFIAVKVLAPGYYARQDTRTPVRIAVIAMVSNMALNLTFVGILLSLHFKGPHAGLALASTVAAYMNAWMLYRGLRRKRVYRPEAGWGTVLFAVAAASALMVIGILLIDGTTQEWLMAPARKRGYMLSELVVGGTLAYIVALFAAGLRKHHLEKGAV
ncbi:MAG: murein biosynthesis integral membrane protein MurJ, partial [Lysobacterales bacterium]